MDLLSFGNCFVLLLVLIQSCSIYGSYVRIVQIEDVYKPEYFLDCDNNGGVLFTKENTLRKLVIMLPINDGFHLINLLTNRYLKYQEYNYDNHFRCSHQTDIGYNLLMLGGKGNSVYIAVPGIIGGRLMNSLELSGRPYYSDKFNSLTHIFEQELLR